MVYARIFFLVFFSLNSSVVLKDYVLKLYTTIQVVLKYLSFNFSDMVLDFKGAGSKM